MKVLNMNKTIFSYPLKLITGLILLFGMFGLSYAGQTLPTQFDLDGYVNKVMISEQTIYLSGYPYKINLETNVYGLNGTPTSLLNLNSKTKVGVLLTPYIKGQNRVVKNIWILPANYELESQPL